MQSMCPFHGHNRTPKYEACIIHKDNCVFQQIFNVQLESCLLKLKFKGLSFGGACLGRVRRQVTADLERGGVDACFWQKQSSDIVEWKTFRRHGNWQNIWILATLSSPHHPFKPCTGCYVVVTGLAQYSVFFLSHCSVPICLRDMYMWNEVIVLDQQAHMALLFPINRHVRDRVGRLVALPSLNWLKINSAKQIQNVKIYWMKKCYWQNGSIKISLCAMFRT